MPSWWGKPSSKEVKQKTNRGSFIGAIHRKCKSGSEDKRTGKYGGSQRYSKDTSERGVPLSESASLSLQVSHCHSFSEQPHAQPLPLPGLHFTGVGHADSGIRTSSSELHGYSKPLPISPPSRHGYDPRKPLAPDAWGDLATASVSSDSSMDTNDQPDSQFLSPQASDYGSGNVTAINSPSRNGDHSPNIARKILKDDFKPFKLPSSNHIPLTSNRRGPYSAHVSKLHIPPRPRVGFLSAPDSSLSSPSRSPVRACACENTIPSGFSVGRQCSYMNLVGSGNFCSPTSVQNSGHNSVGELSLFCPQSRCSPECSPISSPKMTSPGRGSWIQSGGLTPLHPQPGGLSTGLSSEMLDAGKPQSHKLPLPPVTVSSSCPFLCSCSTAKTPTTPRNPGRAESLTSPVSHWKKGRLIGSGTFGRVYLGFNSETGEMCAMKEVTLFFDDAKIKESAQQLEQEITLLSCLRHPNIVRYFGSEMVDSNLYIYLEYVSGGSINKLLREYGHLGESAIRSYTQQILSGLAYLHAKNTVHRDIKGANILVDPSGQVKLADFGMAKHITGQSCPLSFKGSPYWMAPEVIMNSNGCNLAVDIWSLGCTVIEMATAKPPWSQYEGVAALFKIGNSKELPAIPDNLSEDGKDFVRQCLQRNPQDRPTAVRLLEHPFVRNAAPPERCFLKSELPEPRHTTTNAARYMGTGLVQRNSSLDLEGVAVKLSRGFKNGSSAPRTSKHVSCPVSPISSPLSCPKSSQSTRRRRSPTISSPHTASRSSTTLGAFPINHIDHSTPCSLEGTGVRRPQKQNLYANGRPKPETLCGIPETSQGNRDTRSCRGNLAESHLVVEPLHRGGSRELYDRQSVLAGHVSQQLLMDQLKLNPSPGLSVLGHTDII